MKAFSLVFVIFFQIINPVSAQDACNKIAKINYRDVERLLIDKVLLFPQNKELSDSFRKAEEANKASQDLMMQRMVKAQKDGKLTLDMNDVIKNDGQSDFYAIKSKVEQLAREEFEKIIATSFSDSYDIVIEDGWNKQILYTKCALSDITHQFRQGLIAPVNK